MEQFSDQMETRGPCVSPGGHARPRQVEQIVLGSTGRRASLCFFLRQQKFEEEELRVHVLITKVACMRESCGSAGESQRSHH